MLFPRHLTEETGASEAGLILRKSIRLDPGHWADPIVLNFNRHPPSSELTLVNVSGAGPDSVLMK